MKALIDKVITVAVWAALLIGVEFWVIDRLLQIMGGDTFALSLLIPAVILAGVSMLVAIIREL